MLDDGMFGDTLEFQCEKRDDTKDCPSENERLHVSEERVRAQVSTRCWNLRRVRVSCKLMSVRSMTMINHNRGDHGNPSAIIWHRETSWEGGARSRGRK